MHGMAANVSEMNIKVKKTYLIDVRHREEENNFKYFNLFLNANK
jgi:hypothetical protein